ncbi:MAG: small subunit ribosomal protein S17 [Alteromonas naphthalenivorans]|jgi:small subunit ribosomal protein S17
MSKNNKVVSEQQKQKRILLGEVISDKMDKTVVVRVTRKFKHPFFGKVLKVQKNYKVHDQNEESSKGDTVEIQEGRPLSKTKHMYLTRIIKKSDLNSSPVEKKS